ncbi:MAG TPA: hypothetical protein VF486_21255 [Actinomycetes bacterium]
MAAFLLFVLAFGGGVVVADLLRENTAIVQVTVFHQPVGAYPQGWLLALAAGLGFAVAMLLVASVAAANRRAHRREGRSGRQRLETRAPATDQDRLLDQFFGPDEAPGQPIRRAGPAHLRGERREGPARRAVRPHDDIDRRYLAGRRW